MSALTGWSMDLTDENEKKSEEHRNIIKSSSINEKDSLFSPTTVKNLENGTVKNQRQQIRDSNKHLMKMIHEARTSNDNIAFRYGVIHADRKTVCSSTGYDLGYKKYAEEIDNNSAALKSKENDGNALERTTNSSSGNITEEDSKRFLVKLEELRANNKE